MKRYFPVLLLSLCCTLSMAQKSKSKKNKKADSTIVVPVPPVVEERIEEAKIDVVNVEGVKDEGSYVAAPVEDYYGSRKQYKVDTVRTMLDANAKYYQVTINNGSSYYSKNGVEDGTGKPVLPVVYSAITKCDDGYILKLGTVNSLVDADFRTIFPMEYSSIEPIKDRGLYLLRKRAGATRIVDRNGADLVQGDIIGATPLNYRYATLNNKTDFLQLENMEAKKAIYDLNRKKLVLGFVAKNITAYEGGIIVTDDTSSRILNSKDLSPMMNESFTYVQPPRYAGGFIVSKKGKMGLVSAGKYVLPCEYNSITPIENSGIATLYITNKNNKYTCVDYLGKNILNETFDYMKTVYRSSGNQLLVRTGKKYGIKDYLNHILVPIEFDTIYHSEYGSAYTARSANKVTVYSNQGSILNELEFESLLPIGTSGTFIYQKNKKFGLATSNFELLTEAVYDKIEPFNAYGYSSYSYSYSDAHFRAIKSGKMGLISRRGEILLPFMYDLIEQLDDYAILLKQNGKYGLAKKSGYTAMAPCEYDSVGNQYDNTSTYSSSSRPPKYIGIKNREAFPIAY